MPADLRAYTLIFLFDLDAERVLLIDRHADRADMPGYLNGLGGKFEPGESIEVAAQREVYEEAGVLPIDLEFHGTESWIALDESTGLTNRGTLFIFTATHLFGTVNEGCAEGTLGWYDLEEALKHPRLAPNLATILPLLMDSPAAHYVGIAEYSGDGYQLVRHDYLTW